MIGDLVATEAARRALLEIVVVGLLCGIVGVHVVLRRLSFFAMTMGHAMFPGVVVAALLGVPLLLGAGVFGVLLVVAIVAIGAQRRLDDTNATGVVLAGGLALAVLLLSTRAGFSRDLATFLVGSLVTVSTGDIAATAGVAVVVLAVLGGLHKELTWAAFDRAGLAARGYPVFALDVVLLLAVQVTVVACVPAVGTFLPVALLAAPAAAARLWTDRFGPTVALSVAFAVGSGVVGLLLSQQLGIAAGAAVVLVAAGVFVVSLLTSPRHGFPARLRPPRVPGSPQVPGSPRVPGSSSPAAREPDFAPVSVPPPHR